jgi:hypothetical protein
MLRQAHLDRVSGSDRAAGWVRAMEIDEQTQEILRIVEAHNDILYGWADVATRQMAGQPGYQIATMYFEFENVASPGDPVTVPTFDRSGGVAYYNGLSGNKDYLRIPITLDPTITSSDLATYVGNQITFFAITQGTEGMHGLPFSDTVNSEVYGYALVASPEPDDQTSDIVVARAYNPQIGKVANRQIGAQYAVQFG